LSLIIYFDLFLTGLSQSQKVIPALRGCSILHKKILFMKNYKLRYQIWKWGENTTFFDLVLFVERLLKNKCFEIFFSDSILVFLVWKIIFFIQNFNLFTSKSLVWERKKIHQKNKIEERKWLVFHFREKIRVLVLMDLSGKISSIDVFFTLHLEKKNGSILRIIF
jgi:hypothetical protein